MFFVTLILNELVAWMRSQPGTTSLRTYRDEVFGYFPPTVNPPSKTPMLTLLKQASEPGESEADFRIRLGQLSREARDEKVEKLRKRYVAGRRKGVSGGAPDPIDRKGKQWPENGGPGSAGSRGR